MGQSVRAIKAALMLGVMISAGAAPLAPSLAQEAVVNDTGVYGKNVARADFPGGSYRMIAEREWGRYDENDKLIRTYVELRRDDWAVELRQPGTEVFATIDTLRNAVLETDPSTNILTEFAKIGSVAPRGDMARVPLPRIPADYPDWYKEAWNARFNPANQGFRPGASVAANSAQSGQDATFAIGSSQPSTAQSTTAQTTPGQTTAGQLPAQGSTGGFNPFSNPGAPQQTGAGQPTQTAQNAGGFDPNAPWLAAQGGGQPQTAAAPPVQQNNPFAPPPSSAPPTQQNNPFALPAGQQTGQQSGPPAWAQGQQQGQQAAAPPWGQNAGINGGGGQFGEPETPAQGPHSLVEGVWVELNRRTQPEGDGTRTAITWSSPKYLRVIPLSDNSVALLTGGIATAWNVLNRQSETRYSGSGMNVNITKTADSLYLNVSGGSISGRYEIARTANGDFSRDRFDIPDRDSRRGLFNQDGLTREWNTNFHSFDGLDMNLFDPLAGRRQQIFKQPGDFDYAIDDNLNLGLPYGLRGYRTRMSSSRQTEALITNAASFQRSMSMNFGGGISTPKASFGASYSYEKTSGTRQRSSNMSALGFARIERYTLILDEPNAQLSENFKRAVESLADGRMSAQNFVSTFGTHYAKAISYGGLGKAEKTMTSMQVAEFLSEKSSYSANGGAKGATLNGGFSEGKSTENSTESVFTRDEFEAVGGSGAMSFNGWQVSDNDTVPVRYDLRRLSDLITPLFFDMKSFEDATKYLRAHNKLRTAIDQRMNGAPPFANGYAGPKFYEIELHSLRCTAKGDEKTDTVTLRGNMELAYTDDTGPKSISLFSNAAGEAMTCGSGRKNLTLKPLIVLSNGSSGSSSRDFGSFSISSNLTEVDEGPRRSTGEQVRDGFLTGFSLGLANRAVRDIDDTIGGASMLQPLVRTANGERRTMSFGRNPAPTIVVDYTVREIN